LSRYPVPWIAGNPILNQSYTLHEFKEQSAGLGVDTMVYVQAAWASEYSLLEADYYLSIACRLRYLDESEHRAVDQMARRAAAALAGLMKSIRAG
jgi:predicted TIM-barrel fold metal-dependent hydrolase